MDILKKLNLSIMVLIFMFTIVSCEKKPTEVVKNLTDEEIINDVISNLEVPATTHTGLNLPSEVNGVQIDWSSEEPLAFNTEEIFYVTSKGEYSFTVYATFYYSDLEVSNTYDVSVEMIKDNVFDSAWDYYRKKIPSTTLISFYPYQNREFNGCTATYKSFNTEVISDDGKVKQYNIDQNVLFNTYIKSSDKTVIYPTMISVPQFTDAQRVDNTRKWINEKVEEIKLNEGTYFPTYNEEYDTHISWYSLSFGLINSSGIIIRPIVKTDVSFGCTITRNSTSATVSFEIKDFGGDITMEDQLKLWAEAMLPTIIRGTRNTVDPADDHLTEQVRTNSNGVLNFIDGSAIEIDQTYLIDHTDSSIKNKLFGSSSMRTNTHPNVSQATLNELFYEGYQMPNEQNILWIVVHESGMPGSGNNAKLLADLQYRSAYVTEGPREASWNYQVDENKIYQSFADEVVCWHAGDGTSREGTGNNNGIGIEMCVNNDGNYDGAMHLDAKLVAYLLHKYNLTLDNVKRHFDFSGKICPEYMIRTGRWTEFLELVDREYMAYKYNQEGVKISWSISEEGNTDSAAVLNKYFQKGASGTYFSKPVSSEVKLMVEIKIEYNEIVFTKTKEITLNPTKSSEDNNE